MESAPLKNLSKGVIYFLIGYYNKSKECLKVVKILPDPFLLLEGPGLLINLPKDQFSEL